MGENEEGAQEFYLEITDTEERVGNHHPIYPDLPSQQEANLPFARKLLHESLTKEERAQRNEKLRQMMYGDRTKMRSLREVSNYNQLYTLLRQLVAAAVGDLLTIPTKNNPERRRMQAPQASFYQKQQAPQAIP